MGVLAAFVGMIAVRNAASRQRTADRALAQQTTISPEERARGVTRLAVVSEQDGRQLTSPLELRRRVANLSNGTYIGDVLLDQDSVLYRWPDRMTDAIRVWVQPTAEIADWKREYPETARTVFDEWSAAGFPLTFTFIFDSTSADIAIQWVDRFDAESGQRIGQTDRTQSSTSYITRARVLTAVHDSAGRPLSSSTIAGILRHEVGHALGLNHANDRSSVMFHESATTAISASDRATLRLIYLVPAGTLRN